MKRNKNLTLMADIMKGIYQSDEWQNILETDLTLATDDDRYNDALERAKSFLPKAIYRELSDAHTDEVTDAGEIGIQFGIRVVNAMRDVFSESADLSGYVRRKDNDPQYNLEDIVRRLGGILRDLQTEIDAAEGCAAKRISA